MANNYSQTSLVIDQITPEQRAWITQVLELDPQDNGNELDALLDTDYFSREEPWDWEFEWEWESRHGKPCLWIYADYINCETLETFLQGFLSHFNLNRGIGFQVGFSCSKMREDEFGGYAAYVTKDKVEYVSTYQWLMEKDREHNGEGAL